MPPKRQLGVMISPRGSPRKRQAVIVPPPGLTCHAAMAPLDHVKITVDEMMLATETIAGRVLFDMCAMNGMVEVVVGNEQDTDNTEPKKAKVMEEVVEEKVKEKVVEVKMKEEEVEPEVKEEEWENEWGQWKEWGKECKKEWANWEKGWVKWEEEWEEVKVEEEWV